MVTEQQLKYEETIAQLSQIAKDKGDDFIVRITRRRKDSSFAESVGTLADARLEHFLVGPKTPELWLKQFAGGAAAYLLQVYHTSNMEKPIGGLLPIQVPGLPFDPSPEAVDSTDWVGPGRCLVPERKKPGQEPPYMAAPSSPHQPHVATNVERNGGGGTPALNPQQPPGLPPEAAREIIRQQEEITRQKMELAEERRKLEVAQARKEADAQIAAAKSDAESRARLERERSDRLERDLAELRNRIATQPAATPTPPQSDRFAELMMEMRKSDQEQRRLEREFQAEQRRAEREAATERAKIEAEARAEQERIRAEAAKSNAELQTHLIKVATEKPSGSEMAEKVLLSVTSAISGLMSNQVNMINAMNELGFGGGEEPEPEPRWLKTVERMVRGFAAVSQQRQPQQPQQGAQLPPPNYQQQQALPPRPAPAPPQQPQTAPAPQPTAPQQPQTTNGLPGNGGEPSMEIVEQLQKAITGKTHDPGTIAEFILGNMNDAGLQRLLVSKERLSEIVEELVGDEWLDDRNNVAFAKAVAQAFVERGSERGLFDAETMRDTLADLDTLGQ